MDKETYEALKIVLQRAYLENKSIIEREAIAKVRNWIDEVAKDYKENNVKCEGCGKDILKGQSVIEGENRHSACA
jgi:hypothetical protein